jgi:anti-sigma B factor antagonist
VGEVEPREVVVDLADARLVDSAALGALVDAARRLRARGGELVLATDDAVVLKMLDVTGLARLFRVHDSLEGAIVHYVDNLVAR